MFPPAHQVESASMLDTIYVASALIFFAIMAAYAHACARL